MATAPAPDEQPDPGNPTTRDEVFQLVKGILVEQLGVNESKVTESASIQGDLDADSLDLVELIMELEDKTKIKISDDEAAELNTVGEVVDYICDRLRVPR